METNVSTKSVRIFVRDLPPLHEYVLRHKYILADVSYVLKSPSAASPQGIHIILRTSPILIANMTGEKYTIGGHRSWALSKQMLDGAEKIPAMELNIPDDKTLKAYAIGGIFLPQLISEPQKSSSMLFEQELQALSPDDRAIFNEQLPGAASNRHYTRATGIREGTLYHRKNRASSQTHDEGDQSE
jgi:hypothetical protein